MTIYQCPYCKSDLTDRPIQEEHREHYGGATHGSRIIGIYSRERDMTVAWKCPDCEAVWSRSTGRRIPEGTEIA